MKKLALTFTLMLGMVNISLGWSKTNRKPYRMDRFQNFRVIELTESQQEDLLFMWEEEKVARDVYLQMSERYSMRIFSNIARSEQRHMDAIEGLIHRYGLEVPSVGAPVGEFSDAGLQALHDELVERGLRSLQDALEVGLDIEVLDIQDLEARIPDATPDAARVYGNLLRASHNHKAAFSRFL